MKIGFDMVGKYYVNRICIIFVTFISAIYFINYFISKNGIHMQTSNDNTAVNYRQFDQEDGFETSSLRSNHRALGLSLPYDNVGLKTKVCMQKKLRFITFSDREQISDDDSYAKLLCGGRAVHVAPSEASACLKTIIKEEKYDIFVLDYYRVANEGLTGLVHKIKSRFPRASIILLHDYYPIYTEYETVYGTINVAIWAVSQGFTSMTPEALKAFENSHIDWRIKDFNEQEIAFNSTINSSGGWVVYRKTNAQYQMFDVTDVKSYLLNRAHLYSNWNKYNKKGNEGVSKQIFDVFNYHDVDSTNITYSWYKEEDPIECSVYDYSGDFDWWRF